MRLCEMRRDEKGEGGGGSDMGGRIFVLSEPDGGLRLMLYNICIYWVVSFAALPFFAFVFFYEFGFSFSFLTFFHAVLLGRQQVDR